MYERFRRQFEEDLLSINGLTLDSEGSGRWIKNVAATAAF